MTAELLAVFVTPKPQTKPPDQTDNKPINKTVGQPKNSFIDCIKKEVGKDSSRKVNNHDSVEPATVSLGNKPDQLEFPQENDTETQGVMQEPDQEDSTAANLTILTTLQAPETSTLIAVNTVSVELDNEMGLKNSLTGQVVSLSGENYLADEPLVVQPSNVEPLINLNQVSVAGKELINQTSPTTQSTELPPETKPAIGMQTEGQKPPEVENDSLLKAIKTEQLPIQLLGDERPDKQEKNLIEKQVDVKKLMQMENYRNLSQRVASANPQPQMNVQQEGSGKQTEGEVINLPGQLTAESNLTSRGSSLENTNLSSLTAKPDPADVMDQIVKKATIMLKANVSEMKIELKPEFLGKLMIKIVVEDGLMTAKFVTESQQVKNLLESNLITLRQSLEAQGIRVEKTEVNIGLNNGGMFDGSEGEQKWMWNQDRESPHRGETYTENDLVLGSGELDDKLSEAVYTQAYGFQENGSMDFVI